MSPLLLWKTLLSPPTPTIKQVYLSNGKYAFRFMSVSLTNLKLIWLY